LIDENLKDASGNKTTPEALFYSNNAEYLGMKAEWLNKPVTFGGRVLTIVGLKNSRSQKPVLFKIEGRNGTFIASTGDARTWFGLKRDLSAEDFRLVEVAPPVKGAA
jgi:hypothetical protein